MGRLSENYPKTCPEGAVEVTSPLTHVALDVRTGVVTCTFAPGETVDLALADLPSLAPWGGLFIEQIAGYLASTDCTVVWADPALIEKTLDDKGVPDRAHGGVPF